MDEVNVRYVSGSTMHEVVEKCMVQYGYGYTKLVFLDQDGNGAVLSDEHISVDDTEINMILDYYQGDSSVNHLLDAKGKQLTLVD